MLKTLVTSIVGLVVGCSITTGAIALAKPNAPSTLAPNTITQQEITKITEAAVKRNDEAAVCIQSLYFKLPEVALGYCFSWKLQALDDKEIAAADFWVKAAAKHIAHAIGDERI